MHILDKETIVKRETDLMDLVKSNALDRKEIAKRAVSIALQYATCGQFQESGRALNRFLPTSYWESGAAAQDLESDEAFLEDMVKLSKIINANRGAIKRGRIPRA